MKRILQFKKYASVKSSTCIPVDFLPKEAFIRVHSTWIRSMILVTYKPITFNTYKLVLTIFSKKGGDLM